MILTHLFRKRLRYIFRIFPFGNTNLRAQITLKVFVFFFLICVMMTRTRMDFEFLNRNA